MTEPDWPLDLPAWYAGLALVAFAGAVPLVRLAERLGHRFGLVDLPRPGEVQTRPLPRTGGYGLFLAFWLAIGLSFLIGPDHLERLAADNWRLLGLFLGSLVILPLALLDDIRRLGPLPQLIGHAVIAAIPVFFGLRIQEIATPFGILALPEALGGPLAALWVVAMINAINLLDTMDGLAAGIAAIAAGVLFLRSAWFGQASIAVIPVCLLGAGLGFLTRNWHPARVILGSSGAVFLGYVLGATTVIGGAKIGTAFLVLAVPILDLAWVAYRRLAEGRSPFRGGDAQHIAQRLRLLGLRDPAVVLLLYAITACAGLAVLATHSAVPTVGKLYLAAGLLAAIAAGLALVHRLSRSRDLGRRPPSP